MKIGIAGYTGRVGQLLIKELQSGSHPSLTLAGGSSRSAKTSALFPVFATMDELCAASDCVIDFTTPEAIFENVQCAARHKKKMVIGTTGLTDEHMTAIKIAAAEAAIVQASNTSVGVTLLLSLVEQAAEKLNAEWDIEIFETHHKNKIDAPSGTALALGNAAKNGRKGGAFSLDRNGKRESGQIGYAVSRGGDVVGEHMVTFYGAGERIELGHKATDRALFARGALTAAQFLTDKSTGLYAMRDVLGL